MAGYNRFIIMGNLTRDPEYKQLPSGQGVCNLGIASNRQYKNKQTGMMIQEVCFIDADVFGPQADSCKKFLQKGSPVLIEGRIKFDSWQTDGQKRSKHSVVADRVVFLGSGDSDAEKMGMSKGASFDKTESSMEDFDFPEDEPTTSKGKKGRQSDELSFKDEPPFQDDLPF